MAIPQERLRGERPAAAAATQGLRVSWGGVWSGFLVAIGVMLLLATLGAAIGMSAVDPAATSARRLGVGAGIWTGLTLLLAVFIGGAVAARLGLVFDRPTSALHGVLVWVLSIVAVLYFATSGISLGVNTLLGVAGGVARVAGSAAAGSGGLVGDLTSGDVNQIVARLDDPSTATTVAAATGMSQDDARRALADIRQRVDAARNDPTRAVAEARDGLRQLTGRTVERARTAARTTSWITFGAMALSLVAAIGGAVWGARQAAVRLSAV